MKKQFIALAAAAVLAAGTAQAGDAAAGKKLFDSVCADCHEPTDHVDVSATDLSAKIKGISDRKIKHKGKVKPTDAEIADLVAYFESVKKK